MKKYIQTDQLQKLINWDAIMQMPRYAGGHDEQMRGLFKDSKVIAHWNEGDYQGMVATCVQLPDGRFAIYNDYYGSCSGCDSWEDAGDDEVRNMCIGLANSAYVFNNLNDVIDFLSTPQQERDLNGWSSWTDTAANLLNEITKEPNPEPSVATNPNSNSTDH